ncbi:MAG: DNA repair protein RecO [Oscillospiraceae bacterium]|jgi:DNA repair protein RecO (recombination protein O)|nr:DNA repair protein RecO [Oscillospiraceae bacterium]
MHWQTEGFVLREALYRENDKILTVLTRAEGKRTVAARGARRGGSPLMAAAQPFVYAHMTLFEHRGRLTLDDAEIIDSFHALRADIERLSLAAYLAELCGALAGEVADPALLNLILNACHALAHLQKPPALVKPATEFRMMSLCGFQPTVDACLACGRTPPAEPCLHLGQGGVYCAACRAGLEKGPSLALGADAWQALRHIVHGDARRLFSFALPDSALAALAAAAEAFVLTQLERGFHTLNFYKKLIPLQKS